MFSRYLDTVKAQRKETEDKIGRLEAENAALRKSIAAVEAIELSCHCRSMLCKGYKPKNEVRQLLDDALALAQTDERKAEPERRMAANPYVRAINYHGVEHDETAGCAVSVPCRPSDVTVTDEPKAAPRRMQAHKCARDCEIRPCPHKVEHDEEPMCREACCDPKAARLQAIIDAQGVKPMTSEAFDALAMPAEDSKAAPSLADRYFAEVVTPHGDISDFDGEVLAALRAAESAEVKRNAAIAAVVDERGKDRGPRGFFLERDIIAEAEARLKADSK